MSYIRELVNERLEKAGFSFLKSVTSTTRCHIPERKTMINVMNEIEKSNTLTNEYKCGATNALKYVCGEMSKNELLLISAEEESMVGCIANAHVRSLKDGRLLGVCGRVVFYHRTMAPVAPCFDYGGWASNEDAASVLMFIMEHQVSMSEYNAIISYSTKGGHEYGTCLSDKIQKLDVSDGFTIHVSRRDGVDKINEVKKYLKSHPIPCDVSVHGTDNVAYISVKRHKGDIEESDLTEIASCILEAGIVQRVTE